MSISEAAAIGDVVQLRALLEAGGDPNEAATEEDAPPLVEAAHGNHADAARLLLDAGADMYGANGGGETPLVMAVQRGSLDVFRLLRDRGCHMDASRENVAWMLSQAAEYGHLEVIQWLISQGADVDARDYQGCSALTHAALRDHLSVVEGLLALGADPSHCDDDTETVLMWAADHAGNAPVLRALVQAGADVNVRNDMENTALTWTMRHGDPEMVRALLDGGAAIQPYDLTMAACNGYTEAVRLLLEHGADPSDPGNIATAANRGHRDVANLLRQAITDRQLRERGEEYPAPRYPVGTPVRTLTGTPREGWIVLIEWNHKHGRYGYHIEITTTTQPRKNLPNRYWEDELEPTDGQYTAATSP